MLQILLLAKLMMYLAQVIENFSLCVAVKPYVFHGRRCEFNLIVKLPGPSVQTVQDYLHCAYDVRMNELTHNYEEGHDDCLVGVRRDHVSPVKDTH